MKLAQDDSRSPDEALLLEALLLEAHAHTHTYTCTYTRTHMYTRAHARTHTEGDSTKEKGAGNRDWLSLDGYTQDSFILS